MSEGPVRRERDGDVLSLVLDHPPLNLFNGEVLAALREGVDEARDSGVRALVWRAEGEVFSGGVDVNTFDGLQPKDAEELWQQLLGLIHDLEALPFPTLALIHGLCLTAAWEFSLGCDLIWAAESARFGLVEAPAVGLTPAMGGTQRMAERAGPGRAREFVYTGRLYDAPTLERWGVINRVVADDDLGEKGMAFAQQLASGPTKAHAATKAIVRGYLRGGVEEADRVTPAEAAALFETEDLKRAVKKFLEEGPGKATFEGR